MSDGVLGSQVMFFTIFERILHALSIDITIMYVHLQYATNFIPF